MSFAKLVDVSKQACDLLAPMIRLFYSAMNSETSKLKSDKSVFTIADGIVQNLLSEHLFKGKFRAIVGEENVTVNLLKRPYTVDDLKVPPQFEDTIDDVLAKICSLATQLDERAYNEYFVFIDPIDGTREFATGLGEQSTICIGFSNKVGDPYAGIVYRPIPNPSTYAGGCAAEKIFDAKLDMPVNPNPAGLLTSNGTISPFITALMKECCLTRVPAGGAGNKMLMLLERKGAFYTLYFSYF